MKKMMMFWLVSVFFLVGGITGSTAQKKGSKASVGVVTTPKSILAEPGTTVNITFYVQGLGTDYSLYVIHATPEGKLEILAVLKPNGSVEYRDTPFKYRLSVVYRHNFESGVITIFSTRKEDSGTFYVGIQKDNMFYYSEGTQLTVSSEAGRN